MTTSTDPRPLRPFHTPVRGHAFAHRPPCGAPLDRTPLVLRPEPDNPADPHAVAVWADGGGAPWRVGYLERAVAARLAGRFDAGRLQAEFAGWWEEPGGRWQRPVVCVLDPGSEVRPRRRPTIRRLPPASVTRSRPAA